MYCQYCRRKIGWFRLKFDRNYCSADHRRKGSARSARALRDAGELEPVGLWLSTKDLEEQKKPRPGARNGALAAVLICATMLILLWMAPKDGPMATAVINYTLPQTGFGSSLRSVLPGWQAVRLREDFTAGLRNWSGAAGSPMDWTRENGVIRPGRLRLWTPSLSLTDYQFEFEGGIDQKAMGWTFRSGSVRNYYASKLAVMGRGTEQRLEIVRYIVLDGKAYDRVQLPLPPSVYDESTYRVRVQVEGSRFITSINGQIVDSWNDRRLKRGGVGFFADKGEIASIHWVSVNSVEPGFFSRLFATTLFVPPGL